MVLIRTEVIQGVIVLRNSLWAALTWQQSLIRMTSCVPRTKPIRVHFAELDSNVNNMLCYFSFLLTTLEFFCI
jgi:hypothetical protein